MTHLAPCNHCHRREDCTIRAEVLARLRGLNITKAKLKCAIPREDFPAGTTVSVRAFELVENGFSCGPEYVPTPCIRRGVVSRWHAGKATVILDKDQEIEQPGANAIGYLKVETDRLTKIDAPLQELCKCGLAGERCVNREFPSIRNAKWTCASELGEQFGAQT